MKLDLVTKSPLATVVEDNAKFVSEKQHSCRHQKRC
jgi:hypothetical protein